MVRQPAKKIWWLSCIFFLQLVTIISLAESSSAGLTQLTNGSYDDQYAWYSPDGSKVAYNSGGDIWVMNPDGSGKIQLTFTGNNTVPSWSPDGAKILFNSSRDGKYDLYTVKIDGTGLSRLTYNMFCGHPRWSPDGTKVAFNSAYDIWVVNIDGTNPIQLTRNLGTSIFAEWSPDNKQIAFATNVSGIFNVWLMNSDGSNQRALTNESKDVRGKFWSPDGTKIGFVTDPDDNVIILSLKDFTREVYNVGILGKKYLTISPNGYDLVFSSNVSGVYHLYKYNLETYIGTSPDPVPVAGGLWLIPGLLAGVGMLARRRKYIEVP